jgi:hypothetical protein
MKSPDADLWIAAIDKELKSLREMGIFEVVEDSIAIHKPISVNLLV